MGFPDGREPVEEFLHALIGDERGVLSTMVLADRTATGAHGARARGEIADLSD